VPPTAAHPRGACTEPPRGVPEVAAILGLGQQTVKTHLKRLFAKTGTARQAELVKLVAGYSNALLA